MIPETAFVAGTLMGMLSLTQVDVHCLMDSSGYSVGCSFPNGDQYKANRD